MEPLGRQAELRDDYCRTHGVDQLAMMMTVLAHAPCHTRYVDKVKAPSLMAGAFIVGASDAMDILAERIRQRIKSIGSTQAKVARLVDVSPQRMGNYAQGARTPDLPTLARLASALQTTTDYLLGVSDEANSAYIGVFQRLLELEGLPSERIDVLAGTAARAVQLRDALPHDTDDDLRTRMAAHAAWHSQSPQAPN